MVPCCCCLCRMFTNLSHLLDYFMIYMRALDLLLRICGVFPNAKKILRNTRKLAHTSSHTCRQAHGNYINNVLCVCIYEYVYDGAALCCTQWLLERASQFVYPICLSSHTTQCCLLRKWWSYVHTENMCVRVSVCLCALRCVTLVFFLWDYCSWVTLIQSFFFSASYAANKCMYVACFTLCAFVYIRRYAAASAQLQSSTSSSFYQTRVI